MAVCSITNTRHMFIRHYYSFIVITKYMIGSLLFIAVKSVFDERSYGYSAWYRFPHWGGSLRLALSQCAPNRLTEFLARVR